MKLLFVTPCQLALQDQEVGHSLIAVFHDIKIKIPEDAPEIPRDALLPKEWAIFTKFGLESEDEGKDYSLLTEIFWPDGNLFVRQEMQASQPTRNGMTFIVRMQGFPMGQNGVIRIDQTLSSDGKIHGELAQSEVRVSVEKSLGPVLPRN